MTDSLAGTIDADDSSGAEDAARKARIADLQRQRASRTQAPTTSTVGAKTAATRSPNDTARDRRPAGGAKIAAAGIGFTAMLGLVAAMGYADHSSDPEPPPMPAPTAPAAPPNIVVVIHPSAEPTASAVTVVANPAGSSNQPTVLTAQPKVISTQPRVSAAQPKVRPAPSAPAPRVRTSGSR